MTLQGVDSHRGDVSDVLNEFDAAATTPVALLAYRALFAHMPMLYMSDEEAAAFDEERHRSRLAIAGSSSRAPGR